MATTCTTTPPKRYKIICTDYEESTGYVTRAEVREDHEEHRNNPTTPAFSATCYQPVAACKRFIANQSGAILEKTVYL